MRSLFPRRRQRGLGLLVLGVGAQVVLLGDDLIGVQLLGPLEVGLRQRDCWVAAWR
jgi:hypothetical protein